MMADTVVAPRAPGALELVRAFVNSLDIEDSVDSLLDAEGWKRWSTEVGCEGAATDADLARLRGLREALRVALLANHDRAPLPEEARAAVADAIDWSGARTTVAEAGLALEPAGSGPGWLAGAVVAAVAAALADGTWSRLKACCDDACQWAFYDHSRSRTGQWCSMEVCGNRNKQLRWRERQAGGN